MADQPKKPKPKIVTFAGDDSIDTSTLEKAETYLKNKSEESDYFKLTNTDLNKKKKVPRLGFTQDPTNRDYQGGAWNKRRLLPDEVIKEIRQSDHLIAAILRARGNTLSMFGHLPKDRFDVGIDVPVKKEFEDIMTPDQHVKVQERVDRFKTLLLNCGYTAGLPDTDKMSLATFFYLQAQNGEAFGRFACEIVYDDATNDQETGKFNRFRPIDVGTIKRTVVENVSKSEIAGVRHSAVKELERQERVDVDAEMDPSKEYPWMQKIDNRVLNYYTDKEMLVFTSYPSTDLEHNGYPVTPIDTCLNSIITHMSIEIYNKLFFQNGRAAKGILVIKSDEVDEQVMSDLKQQFMASINNVANAFRTPILGVTKDDDVVWTQTDSQGKDGEFEFLYDSISRNILAAFNMSPDELPGYGHLSKATNSQAMSECLDPNTEILVPSGMKSIYSVLNGKQSVNTMLWNGLKWVESRVFMTGEKYLKETVLSSNLSIRTSPDHRFMVINETGEPEWRHQDQLKIGDFVLTNKKEVTNTVDIPRFNGNTLTVDMMEVLGWLTGDGCVVAPKPRSGAQLNFFYHHEKEVQILERHLQFMKDFGLSPKSSKKIISEEDQQATKDRYGFENTAPCRIKINLYDTDFVKWLLFLGFHSSSEGKVIPSFVHTLPPAYRQAFLRGLFSADGHVNKDANGSVWLTIHDHNLRNQARNLLSTLGIRTNSSEGSTKQMFNGTERETVPCKTKLSIRDKRSFFNQIGFLQDHKQPQSNWLKGNDPEDLPRSTQIQYVQKLIDSDLPRKYKKNIYRFVSDDPKAKMSVARLSFLLSKANLEMPSWLTDYHCQSVKELVDHHTTMGMADVTTYDESHAFFANGFIVHNSNNEFKLEAARDAGLRPLILKFQEFLNVRLFPLMDPELSQICTIEICGLDRPSQDQESQRIQASAPLHGDMDTILKDVDKDPIGEHAGGKLPFSEFYGLQADKYMEVGQIIREFVKDPGAAFMPLNRYRRDPFYLQYLQMAMQINPGAVKAHFATNDMNFDIFQMLIEDELDEMGS